jgi:hypothetical protein
LDLFTWFLYLLGWIYSRLIETMFNYFDGALCIAIMCSLFILCDGIIYRVVLSPELHKREKLSVKTYASTETNINASKYKINTAIIALIIFSVIVCNITLQHAHHDHSTQISQQTVKIGAEIATRHLFYKTMHRYVGQAAVASLSGGSTERQIILPIFLVVSHCKQDLHWLTELTSVVNISDIVVYSKCGHRVVGAPSNAQIRVLPNVGRCDHTYAHYISDLNATEGVVLFVKDTIHVHNFQEGVKGLNLKRSYSEMVELALGPSQFGCRQYINPAVGISNEAISSYLVKYSISKYNMTMHNYTHEQAEPFSIYRDMLAWVRRLSIKLRVPLTPVCYGGIFAVNVKRLRAIDQSVWVGLRDSLSRADNIEEGHFMERSWAGMLSLDPMTASSKYYLNNSAMCFRRNVCGYRGHLVHSRQDIKAKNQRICAGVSNSKIMRSIHRCPPRPTD